MFSGKSGTQLNNQGPRRVSAIRVAKNRGTQPILRLLFSSAIRIDIQDMDTEQQEKFLHLIVRGRSAEHCLPGSFDMADYG
jgi:hypothetical protein